MAEKETFTIEIARRPWYEWLLWALWFLAEIFFLQNAIASGQELEPRAGTIFWVVFGILLLAGAIVWFTRRARLSGES
jgi:hypothetical protein